METSAALILATLDGHLRGSAAVRLMGGAALILGYGLKRFTEDADFVLDDAEFRLLVECGFEDALEATNRELAPRGLYISHVFGPEQTILTPGWRAACRRVQGTFVHLAVETLGPLDLIVSKLARADQQDLEDITWVVRREGLPSHAILEAVRQAVVPEILRDTFSASVPRLEALLVSLGV